MKRFIAYLFGCSHQNYGWPITKTYDLKKLTYTTCLDCGKELKYDWTKMKLVKLDTVEERTIRCEHYGQGVI